MRNCEDQCKYMKICRITIGNIATIRNYRFDIYRFCSIKQLPVCILRQLHRFLVFHLPSLFSSVIVFFRRFPVPCPVSARVGRFLPSFFRPLSRFSSGWALSSVVFPSPVPVQLGLGDETSQR